MHQTEKPRTPFVAIYSQAANDHKRVTAKIATIFTSSLCLVTACIVGTALVASVPVDAQADSSAAENPASYRQQESDVDRDVARFDASYNAVALMQAIKKADPQEYEMFRQTIGQGVREHLTQPQLEEIAAQFTRKITQKHLRRATPAVLKRYLQERYKLYEQLASVSPDALYAYAMTGAWKADTLSEENRNRLKSIRLAFFGSSANGFSNVISAPPADKPLLQNKDITDRRMGEIYQKLTPGELEAPIKKDKSGVNRAAYGNLLLHFYREALKLPDQEAVMVFRLIKELPEDDRATSR